MESSGRTTSATSAIDRIVSQCVAVRLRRLNRMVTGIYDQELRPLRIKVSQLNILVAAAKMGVARPAVVCNVLQLDASTLSRNVDRMKSRGWVEVVDGRDARTQSFRVTPSGLRLIERAAPAWDRAQEKASRLLTPAGVAALKQIIPDLAAGKSV